MSSHLVRVMAVDIQHQNMEDVIPVIDLATLGLQTANVEDVDQLTVDRVCKELDSAFSTTGFFYVENHGVDQTLIDNFFQRSKSFFLLPESTKERYRCGLDNCDGYTGKDGELLDFTALHEIRNSYDVSSPDGLYPDEHAPEFRQAVNELAPPMCELSFRLLRCMAIGLGLEKNFFVDRHLNMFKSAEKNRTIFRTLFYPSLGDADVEPGVVRCGLHSDYGTITILLQDDMGGLEFLTNGKWIPASPIPGKILIFLGDMMQFWTSDRYPATVHRVVVPEEELLRRTPRQSVAFFVHPDNEVMIAPIDGSDKHEPVDALTYVKSRLLASTYK